MTGVESKLARLARRSEHPDRKRGCRVNRLPLADSTIAGCGMGKRKQKHRADAPVDTPERAREDLAAVAKFLAAFGSRLAAPVQHFVTGPVSDAAFRPNESLVPVTNDPLQEMGHRLQWVAAAITKTLSAIAEHENEIASKQRRKRAPSLDQTLGIARKKGRPPSGSKYAPLADKKVRKDMSFARLMADHEDLNAADNTVQKALSLHAFEAAARLADDLAERAQEERRKARVEAVKEHAAEHNIKWPDLKK